MDEKEMPGGIQPETEADGERAFTAEAPEHDGPARAVIPVVGVGASAGGSDEKEMPGGIQPETEADGERAFTAEAPEHDGPARAVIPVVGVGASAGGLE